MAERGLRVDHSTSGRCVLRYPPELQTESAPGGPPAQWSWKVDETYVRWRLDLPVPNGGRCGRDHRLHAERLVQFIETECVIRRTIFWKTLLIILDKPEGRTGTSLEVEAGAIRCNPLERSLGRGHCAKIRWWPSTSEPGARTPQQTTWVGPDFEKHQRWDSETDVSRIPEMGCSTSKIPPQRMHFLILKGRSEGRLGLIPP
jgi:hypothetical protein